MDKVAEFLVIGAGIAGASAAFELARHAPVILLEQEAQPGYHTTGRSAAVYTEIYGNEVIRALTIASKAFFRGPPAGFSEVPLYVPRPLIMIARNDQVQALEVLYEGARKLVPDVAWLDVGPLAEAANMLRPGYAVGGVIDPQASDLDVHAIHHGFWRGAKAAGCDLRTNAGVERIERSNGFWQVKTPAGVFGGRVLVNAAGAWADEIAAMAGVRQVGLVPKRRTAFTFLPAPARPVDGWPTIIDVCEKFYFKPDAGRVLGSPADETASPPCDAQPEEIDIAIAIDRICKAVDFEVPRIESKWAGLRSFVADKTPVAGYDPEADGFFWLAGQGGYGIQTSPAMGRMAAALALEATPPADLLDLGLDANTLSPVRLQQAEPDRADNLEPNRR